jgi:hypothetical protein
MGAQQSISRPTICTPDYQGYKKRASEGKIKLLSNQETCANRELRGPVSAAHSADKTPVAIGPDKHLPCGTKSHDGVRTTFDVEHDSE